MLWIAAIAVGALHTLLGPDHYLPFLVIGRSRRWRLRGTLLLTLLCGLGHVLSSVAIGLVGIAAGAALHEIKGLEATRGEIAGFALVLFGAGYTAYGVFRALRGKRHAHPHLHEDGTLHLHGHDHRSALSHPPLHAHGHAAPAEAPIEWKSLTPWILFLVFVLGPCEPLVPLFFASAVAGDWREAALVVGGYSAATLATMLAIVSASWAGLRAIDLGPFERWSHAAAGAVVLLSGLSVTALGL